MKKILILGMLLLFTGCTFQHGTSRDIVQGWDSGILWNHMYLKNDHNTCYCFDNPQFVQIFDESQKTQKEVIVTYETYLVRGGLCSASEKYETVIITDVEFVEE